MDEKDSAAAGAARPDEGTSDPVRDLLLGLANQIDQLAALFGPGSADVVEATFGTGGSVGRILTGASGEISTLITEIGDLLARLLTAVIAVLEAIAEALRSAPAETSAPRHYQPIPVRINVSGATPERGTDG